MASRRRIHVADREADDRRHGDHFRFCHHQADRRADSDPRRCWWVLVEDGPFFCGARRLSRLVADAKSQRRQDLARCVDRQPHDGRDLDGFDRRDHEINAYADVDAGPSRRPLLQDAADVCGKFPIRENADTELVLIEEVERLGFCQTRDIGHNHRQWHRQRERDRRIDDHAPTRRRFLRQHRSYRLPRFLALDCAAHQLRVTE